jgi:hypothetical protein
MFYSPEVTHNGRTDISHNPSPRIVHQAQIRR